MTIIPWRSFYTVAACLFHFQNLVLASNLHGRAEPSFAGGELDKGSLNGFWTYTEVVNACKLLAEKYPTLVEYGSIGNSVEGRPMPILTLTNKQSSAVPLDSRPALLLTSLSRGNEPLSLATLLNIVRHIVQNSADVTVAQLLSSTKIVSIPMVNPDAWNAATTSQFHIKNMRDVCSKTPLSRGVDLTTNWGFHWDTYLPSSDLHKNEEKYEKECSEYYHGADPFSEPETAALKAVIETSVKPKSIIFFRQTDAATPSIIVPYTYHPSNSAIQTSRSLFRAEDAKVYESIITGMNASSEGLYTAGTTWDMSGQTISGSDLDWAFDQAGIFSVMVQVAASGDKSLQTAASKHLNATLALANLMSALPSKSAKPNKSPILKHIKKAVLNIPLILGAIAALLLAVGFATARFLGYDKIWDRFVLGVQRLKRWKMYRNYTSLGASGKDDDEEDEDFGWALDEGIAEEGGFER
ncbi:hypothetical protein DFJ77DRAFT_455120 [Powellomyces hirtus]|nr:hypothetical protein DFJ77DRAFT_455120 [Powellomyces hirtus]